MPNSSTILTAPQQVQLASWSRNLRAALSMHAKLIDAYRGLNAAYNAANGASTLLGLLSASDTIDDGNGLDGSAPMTKQNLIDRVSNLESELGTYDNSTYQGLWAQACGATNL